MGKVTEVVLSWVASPLMGGLLAFFTFFIVRATILEAPNPIERSRWMAPLMALPTFFVLGIALQFKALKGLIARLGREGVIADKYDWLPVKEMVFGTNGGKCMDSIQRDYGCFSDWNYWFSNSILGPQELRIPRRRIPRC